MIIGDISFESLHHSFQNEKAGKNKCDANGRDYNGAKRLGNLQMNVTHFFPKSTKTEKSFFFLF